MRRQSALLDPIAPAVQEAPALQEMDRAFSKSNSQPRLVSPEGEELVLPESLYQVLKEVVHMMASGRAIHLVPVNMELTTQEAADLLNVSRPHLVNMLESGQLPYRKVGTHRRVLFEDVMNYKHARDLARQRALDEMARLSQEEGEY